MADDEKPSDVEDLEIREEPLDPSYEKDRSAYYLEVTEPLRDARDAMMRAIRVRSYDAAILESFVEALSLCITPHVSKHPAWVALDRQFGQVDYEEYDMPRKHFIARWHVLLDIMAANGMIAKKKAVESEEDQAPLMINLSAKFPSPEADR